MGLPFSRRGGGAALGVVFGGAPVGGAGRTLGRTRTQGNNEAVGGGRGGGRSAAHQVGLLEAVRRVYSTLYFTRFS